MNKTTGKQDILQLTFDELSESVEQMGERKYRAAQIYEWLHVKFAASFDEMTDISKELRYALAAKYHITAPRLIKRQVSKDGVTEKYLFALDDGRMIESVLMRHDYGNSVCVSSQAGCRMGCRFCATAINGLERDLAASEMLGQIYRIMVLTGEKISHADVMGMGEPLDNYDSLTRFIGLLCDARGPNISKRAVTVSTCGIVPGIIKLADENCGVTLALSLHAVTQEKRVRLMPAAAAYPLSEVLSACDYYRKKTGRRVTFEYCLIDGENDGDFDADELSRLAKKHRAHVNLIPANKVSGRPFRRPGRAKTADFKNKLEKNGINVTIRRSMGSDIRGACGQLRALSGDLKETTEDGSEEEGHQSRDA